MPDQFEYQLGESVKLTGSGESGVIIGRADYTDAQPAYLIRYVASDGRMVEQWWNASALGRY